jgi:hypothetical protein
MGRLKKILTRERADEVRLVISSIHYVEGPLKNGNLTRVEALRKLGYRVRKSWLRGGSAPVGKIHHYKKELRMQIGSTNGGYGARWAWCVIFDSIPYEKVHKYNLEILPLTCL